MFKHKCIVCESTNTTVAREAFFSAFWRQLFNVLMPIRFFTGHARAPRNVRVCRDCGFKYEL